MWLLEVWLIKVSHADARSLLWNLDWTLNWTLDWTDVFLLIATGYFIINFALKI